MDCRIPADALLGTENKGFFQIMANFTWERLTLALGFHLRGPDGYGRGYRVRRERQAFGHPISQFQVISAFADIPEIEAARQLT